MCKLSISGFLLIFLLNTNFVFSQPAGGAPAAGPAGGGIAPPIEVPETDLDQFENSSLKKTKTKYREGQSTLNKPPSQKSNAEVNAEIEKRNAERQKASEETNAPAQDSTKDAAKDAAKDSAEDTVK